MTRPATEIEIRAALHELFPEPATSAVGVDMVVRPRRKATPILVGVGVAGAAAAVYLTANHVTNEPARSTGAQGSDAHPTVYYAVPPAADPRADGAVFSHKPGTPRSDDLSLGRGTDAVAVAAPTADSSSNAVVKWLKSASGDLVVASPSQPDTDINIAAASGEGAAIPLTVLDQDGTRYLQAGESVLAVKGDSIVARYRLPLLKPDPTLGPGPIEKGLGSTTRVGTVSALVPTNTGHILAFTFTGYASAVTDLMTGTTTTIVGYTRTGSAIRTGSGDLLVVAWNDFSSDSVTNPHHIHVLRVDPAGQVSAAIDTGLPAARYLHDTFLPGLGHDGVLAVSHGSQTDGIAINIWTIDGQKATAAAPPLRSAGLAIAPDGHHSVYVYGGPAKNDISVLDLATGKLTPAGADLDAPSGDYVVGIA